MNDDLQLADQEFEASKLPTSLLVKELVNRRDLIYQEALRLEHYVQTAIHTFEGPGNDNDNKIEEF